jgi:hypothetical protein
LPESAAAPISNNQARLSEKIMSVHHSLAAALWLLTAVGAYALVAHWADGAQSGKLQPWVLLIVFWGAALVSVAIHYLSQYLARAAEVLGRDWRRYRMQRWQWFDAARRAVAVPTGLARHPFVNAGKLWSLIGDRCTSGATRLMRLVQIPPA